MDLLTIKKGYDVRVNKVGKKHTDKILEESIKKKLRNNKLWDVIEMLKTLKRHETFLKYQILNTWNIKNVTASIYWDYKKDKCWQKCVQR